MQNITNNFINMSHTITKAYSIPIQHEPPKLFQIAIEQGDILQIEELIDQSALLNDPLPNGELPLHYAVRQNQKEVLTLLLQHGASPQAKDFQGLTAFEHAALMNNDEMSACFWAQTLNSDPAVVQNQINNIKDIRKVNQAISEIIQDLKRMLTVDPSKMSETAQEVFKGNLDVLNNDATKEKINEKDEQGLTLLQYAILSQNPATVAKLISQFGADKDVTDENGNTLLHLASSCKSPEMYFILIKAGVSPQIQNKQGRTPLHYATALQNSNGIAFLRKEGCNLLDSDHIGISSFGLMLTSVMNELKAKDPLKSYSWDALIMAGVAALGWTASVAANGDLLPEFAEKAFSGLAYGCEQLELLYIFVPLLMGSAVAAKTLYQKGLSEEGIASLAGLIPVVSISLGILSGQSSIPGLTMMFLLPKIIQTASSVFGATQKCWYNAMYRPWDTLKMVAVTGASALRVGQLFYTSWSKVQADAKGQADIQRQIKLKLTNSTRPDPFCAEPSETLLRELIPLPLDERLKLVAKDGVSSGKFNTHCASHAVTVIAPETYLTELIQDQSNFESIKIDVVNQYHQLKTAHKNNPVFDSKSLEYLEALKGTLQSFCGDKFID